MDYFAGLDISMDETPYVELQPSGVRTFPTAWRMGQINPIGVWR